MDDLVDSSRRDARKHVLRRQTLDLRLHRCGGDASILAEQVGDNSSDVGGGHGSAGDAVRGGVAAADPGRDDVGAGGPDIDDGAVVGVRGLGVGDGGGGDGDS